MTDQQRGPRLPCPGCGRPTPVRRFACGGCWRRIPGNLRLAIARAWGRRQHGIKEAAAEHVAAKEAATQWLTDNPREVNHK